MKMEDLSIMKAMKKREKLFKRGMFLGFIAIFIFFFIFLQHSARSLPKSVVGSIRYQERVVSAYKFSIVMGIILSIFYIIIIVIWNIFLGINESIEIDDYQLQEIQEVLPDKLFLWKFWSLKSNEFFYQNLINEDLVSEYNKKTFFYVTKYLLFIDRGTRFQILYMNDIRQIIQTKMTVFQYIQKRRSQQVTYKFLMNNGKEILASIIPEIIDFAMFSKVVNYYAPYIEMINERS